LRIFHKRSAVKNRRTTSFGQEQSQSIRVLGGGRELYCVFENFTRRDLALFVLAFAIAGCLMVWTINLSIERLLYADWDPNASISQGRHISSTQADGPGI